MPQVKCGRRMSGVSYAASSSAAEVSLFWSSTLGSLISEKITNTNNTTQPSTTYGITSDSKFSGASASLEARAFTPYGVLTQTGILGTTTTRDMTALRLETTFSYSNPDSLVTYRAGEDPDRVVATATRRRGQAGQSSATFRAACSARTRPASRPGAATESRRPRARRIVVLDLRHTAGRGSALPTDDDHVGVASHRARLRRKRPDARWGL